MNLFHCTISAARDPGPLMIPLPVLALFGLAKCGALLQNSGTAGHWLSCRKPRTGGRALYYWMISYRDGHCAAISGQGQKTVKGARRGETTASDRRMRLHGHLLCFNYENPVSLPSSLFFLCSYLSLLCVLPAVGLLIHISRRRFCYDHRLGGHGSEGGSGVGASTFELVSIRGYVRYICILGRPVDCVCGRRFGPAVGVGVHLTMEQRRATGVGCDSG